MRDDDDPDNAADLMNELDVTVHEMLSGAFCVNDRVPGYAGLLSSYLTSSLSSLIASQSAEQSETGS